jgi:hypothetical protein
VTISFGVYLVLWLVELVLCCVSVLVISVLVYTVFCIVCKGKAIPLQALTGPEGSRRLRLLDFMTIGTWR